MLLASHLDSNSIRILPSSITSSLDRSAIPSDALAKHMEKIVVVLHVTRKNTADRFEDRVDRIDTETPSQNREIIDRLNETRTEDVFRKICRLACKLPSDPQTGNGDGERILNVVFVYIGGTARHIDIVWVMHQLPRELHRIAVVTVALNGA